MSQEVKTVEEDYQRGTMDISRHKRTWDAFMAGSTWGTATLVLVLTYATLTLAVGMHWMVALGITAILGFAGGLFMGLGSAWTALLLGLVGLAVVVQLIIGLFMLLL